MYKRKGFTLIELIVVMAIVGILILLGAPKYMNHTRDAHFTRITVNIKELENASLQYYMRYNSWPRLGDTPYTSEMVEEFGEKILAKTGKVVVLEEGGDYYDIDYSKIQSYVKISDIAENYILQNPVGSVFYIEGITEEAKNRVEHIITVTPNIEGLVNSWVLNSTSSLNDSVGGLTLVKQGIGNYTISDDGIYLDGNVQLKTQNNYSFNSEYTIILYVKNLTHGGTHDGVIGTGSGAAYIGSYYSGLMLYSNGIHLLQGMGDGYSKNIGNITNLMDNNWHVLAYKYDGTNTTAYVDGVLKATAPGNSMKSTPLFIGGLSNSPIYTAGAQFYYTKGYFKNISIYNRALTNDEIASFR